MKITIIGKGKRDKNGAPGETFVNMEVGAWLERIKSYTKDAYILRYRDEYDSMINPDHWVHINHIPRVCAASNHKKNRTGDGVCLSRYITNGGAIVQNVKIHISE